VNTSVWENRYDAGLHTCSGVSQPKTVGRRVGPSIIVDLAACTASTLPRCQVKAQLPLTAVSGSCAVAAKMRLENDLIRSDHGKVTKVIDMLERQDNRE